MSSSTSNSEVAAVILNYNCADLTIELAESLLNFLVPPGAVVIVDNNSDASDVCIVNSYVERRGEIVLISAGCNGGYSAGNNLGVRWALDAGYRYVLIVNPDVSIDEASVEALVRAACADPDVAFCGPRIVGADGKTDAYAQRFMLHDLTSVYLTKYPIGRLGWNAYCARYFGAGVDRTGPQYCVTVSGCCVLFTRRYFDEAGLLDEDFFLYSEEVVWGRNAVALGLAVLYVPAATAIHDHRLTQRQTSFTTLSNRMRSDLIYCRKYLGVRQRVVVPLVLYYYVAFVLLRLINPRAMGGRFHDLKIIADGELELYGEADRERDYS